MAKHIDDRIKKTPYDDLSPDDRLLVERALFREFERQETQGMRAGKETPDFETTRTRFLKGGFSESQLQSYRDFEAKGANR